MESNSIGVKMLNPVISRVNSDEGEKPARIWNFFLHDQNGSLICCSVTFPICPLHSQKLQPVLASCTQEYWRSANLIFITYLWMTENYFLAKLESYLMRPAQMLGGWEKESLTSIPHRPPREGFPFWICLSVEVKSCFPQSTRFLARTQSSHFSADTEVYIHWNEEVQSYHVSKTCF